jgi:hypothetical protein
MLLGANRQPTLRDLFPSLRMLFLGNDADLFIARVKHRFRSQTPSEGATAKGEKVR